MLMQTLSALFTTSATTADTTADPRQLSVAVKNLVCVMPQVSAVALLAHNRSRDQKF